MNTLMMRGALVALLAVGSGACDSFLVTQSLDDTQTLNGFLATTLAPMPAPRHARLRRRLAKALGRFAARLHDAGVLHNDLHAANVLVRVAGDDSPQLFLIDLNAVRLFHRVDHAAVRVVVGDPVALAHGAEVGLGHLAHGRAVDVERRVVVEPDVVTDPVVDELV